MQPSFRPCLVLLVHCDERILRPRYSAFNEQEIVIGIYPHNRQVLHGHSLVTHVAGHPFSLHDFARIAVASGRAGASMRDGHTVGGLLSAEMILLDDAGEPLPFAGSGYMNRLSDFEHRYADFLSDRKAFR